MNKYELTVVFDGKVGSSKKTKFSESLEKMIKIFDGKVLESKDWGIKDLQYKIKKSLNGLFLHFVLEMDPKGAKELNNKLRVDSEILRFLIIKI